MKQGDGRGEILARGQKTKTKNPNCLWGVGFQLATSSGAERRGGNCIKIEGKVVNPNTAGTSEHLASSHGNVKIENQTDGWIGVRMRLIGYENIISKSSLRCVRGKKLDNRNTIKGKKKKEKKSGTSRITSTEGVCLYGAAQTEQHMRLYPHDKE